MESKTPRGTVRCMYNAFKRYLTSFFSKKAPTVPCSDPYAYAKEKYKELIDISLNTLVNKSGEYSRRHPFSNFYQGAGVLGECPERVLLGYLTKHWVSICTLIEDVGTSGEYGKTEVWKEKLIDNINYSLILYAMVCYHKETGEVAKVELKDDSPHNTVNITYRDSEREFR